jgi:pyridoxamine 5'-phosphate oxidase
MELTLDRVMADAGGRLVAAAQDRRHAMHTPVVSTADGDMRIMVLREATADLSRLRFHTDLRSPKCALIGEGAPVSLLAYDPAARVQLRMRGEGWIEHGSILADAAWERSAPSSRRCYLAEAGPGALLDEGGSSLPGDLLHRSPLPEETLPGRSNFAVLMVEVRSLDWLRLTHLGGERARFTRASAALPWRAEWLAP